MAQTGGNEEYTVELNLVPFIDLMSVCIIFLLITAVWSQVSMIQLGASMHGKQTDSGEVEPPPRADITLQLNIKEDGYYLHVGKNKYSFPRTNGTIDVQGLTGQMIRVKEQYPDKNDALVSVSDSLSYEEMIKGMDYLLNSGFGEVSIATGEVE